MSEEDQEHLIAELRSALRDARRYVAAFEPTDYSEAHDADLMLASIDALVPPENTPAPEYCGEQFCCKPKGHEGEHDEIPF